MFIHTVKPGESLYSISKMYNAPIDQILMVNGLEEVNIVPGQALLIPLYVYTVQPGDTLFTIAKKAYVSLQQLRAANPSIKPYSLQPGMKITIPNISNYLASSLNFYVVRTPSLDRELINRFAPNSTAISIFEYHFLPNGDIANDLDDSAAIQTTWENRATPLVTITNLTPQGFGTELVHQMLNNPSSRRNLINNIVHLVTRKGYGGVNIDFERVSAQDRDLFTGFLRELRDSLGRYYITVAVPAKTSEDIPWLRGYDYGGIGSVVDSMFVMAYDWHHPGSEPGPVAPIDEVRRTIEFAMKRVPRNKIMLGVPRYGYNWLLPYRPGIAATSTSNQDAIRTAMKYQVPIQYSQEYKSPFFRYRDEQGQLHEVWFEDVRSISEKMKLVREYKLQGRGLWQIALEFAPGPWLVRKFFTIRKI
ncbi:glycoside hydrolase family 18 protein [Clostridium cylindrosporum]|uniref:Putative sporulation-specific glycosylase YdhD n=1 Tax=Clostridium cylindrosporum DSM 605 TaxID=1121307 RepID=A0A0J8DGF0_CLOCY|nr:glycoside hydrolase family 18 protein [Clostridium cylindrosporum]KMT23309.1 putative sporulation-specific glycosylase YdhD [Clostridium cylindrosporum DSM 605]